MNQTVSVEFDIDQRINQLAEDIGSQPQITLPDRLHPLTLEYTRKIQGKYRLNRSRQDIIDAISLVDIAYKVLPRKFSKNRTMIDHLAKDIIEAQDASGKVMFEALDSCNMISVLLGELFKEWLQASAENDPEEWMDFLGISMLQGVQKIERESRKISTKLEQIAEQYKAIIATTTRATDESHAALAKEDAENESVRKQIAEAQAERAKLQSLVGELEDQMRKYERLASEYKARAESSEERSFITSIIGMFSQMVSASMPAIVAACTGAATGGASIVAGAAAGTMRKIVSGGDEAETGGEQEKEAIALRKELASKTTEKGKQLKTKAALEEKIAELTREKETAETEENPDKEALQIKTEELQKHIEKNQEDLQATESEISTTDARISAIQEALKAFGQGMKQISDEQQGQAASLRTLQMKMLEKAEEYERERRNQNAELIKISALLSSRQSDAEKIELCIKALEINLAALFQMRSIIIEIGFFFSSFASFMNMVAAQAKDQTEAIQSAQERKQLTKSFRQRLHREVNRFFITQSAEWNAAYGISSAFREAFVDGAATLNTKHADYIEGSALAAYLEEARQVLAEISARRKSDSDGTIIEIKAFKALQEAA